MKYSDKQIEDLLSKIYSGEYNNRSMPESLYFAVADYLKKGLYKGYGMTFSESVEGSKDYALLKELRENIYIFSGAKTYNEVVELSSLITEGDTIKTFSEFKELALEKYELYNKAYLETEYNTAIAQAQNAERWQQIEERAELLPYLTYSAVMDENTSEICAPLDGITLPVNHEFWNTFMPQNHWNCRCTVSQTDEATVSSKEEVMDASKVKEDMQDVFQMNSGKDKVVFSDKHPYFEVASKDRDFARTNFGLPIPETDE